MNVDAAQVNYEALSVVTILYIQILQTDRPE